MILKQEILYNLEMVVNRKTNHNKVNWRIKMGIFFFKINIMKKKTKSKMILNNPKKIINYL